MARYDMTKKLLLTAAVSIIVPAFSQSPPAIPIVRGEIRPGEALRNGDFAARVVCLSSGGPPQQASVESNGAFEFHNLPPGSYLFELVRLPAEVLIEEQVRIAETAEPLRFDLPKQAAVIPPGPAVVSADQLRHPPSKGALRAMGKAGRESQGGNHSGAIKELQRAVALSPDYAHAWSNLGVEYLFVGQTEAAIRALQEADRRLPAQALIHTNLSYAYAMTSHYDRAEAEARLAIQMDRNYAKAHYVLGHLLLSRGGNVEEAVENLKMASEEVPKAHLVLADYYLRRADKAAAGEELRAYVASTKDEERARAERSLANLSAGLLPRQ